MVAVSNSLFSCSGMAIQKTHTDKLVFVLYPSNETTEGFDVQVTVHRDKFL